MSSGFFEVFETRESTYPQGRKRAFRILRLWAEQNRNGFPDRLQCFVAGLIKGWILSHAIGIKDADDADETFAIVRPDGGIQEAIPYGHGETAPEVDALREDELLDETWHRIWIGIRNDLFYFNHRRTAMPERSTLSWLGYLRGELEGNGISPEEYERLKAMLPTVDDEFTAFLIANP